MEKEKNGKNKSRPVKKELEKNEKRKIRNEYIDNDEIPTFKAPKDDEIPTFKAPKNGNSSGAVCYNHPSEPAVAKCVRCGHNVCKDCAESCTVSGGVYSGQNLCYDCCRALFEEDKKKLEKDKNKIMFQYVLTIIGVVIGGALGASSGDGLTMLIFAVIGGSFLVAIKPILSALSDMFQGLIELASGGSFVGAIIQFFVGIIQFLIVAIQCAIRTSIKLIKYTNYLIKATKAINADKEALQQLQDFMQYMTVRAKNVGVDLETLMQEGSELYDNSYARVLHDSGEEAADQMLRRATTTIAENGEIIRNFVAS